MTLFLIDNNMFCRVGKHKQMVIILSPTLVPIITLFVITIVQLVNTVRENKYSDEVANAIEFSLDVGRLINAYVTSSITLTRILNYFCFFILKSAFCNF